MSEGESDRQTQGGRSLEGDEKREGEREEEGEGERELLVSNRRRKKGRERD